MLTLESIREAATALAGTVKHTPLERSRSFSAMTGTELFLKLENLQTTGSFKLRGAFNKIRSLGPEERGKGVVCASAGNHAQGVAFSASALGVRSTVFMPIYSPPSKIQATRAYGAEVILEGETYDDACLAARANARGVGATFVHAFDDELVMAGQGTIGLEILEDLPQAEVVLVPVGGGGLIAGVATALKALRPEIRIVGVEAEGAQSMRLSLERGVVTPLTSLATIADGIAVKTPAESTFAVVRRLVDEVVVVDDEATASAVFLLLQRAKLLAEPAGAVALGALLSGAVRLEGRTAVALLSGGNIDLALLDQIVEKGLFRGGLMARIAILLPDKPGFLKAVLGILAERRINVHSIDHERNTATVPVGWVRVALTLRTSDPREMEAVRRSLTERGLTHEILA